MERKMGKLTSLLIICCFLSGFMMIASGCNGDKEEITLELIVNIKGRKSYLNTEIVLYLKKRDKKELEKEQRIPALRETVIRALSEFNSEDNTIEDAKKKVLKAIEGFPVVGLNFNKFVMQ